MASDAEVKAETPELIGDDEVLVTPPTESEVEASATPADASSKDAPSEDAPKSVTFSDDAKVESTDESKEDSEKTSDKETDEDSKDKDDSDSESEDEDLMAEMRAADMRKVGSKCRMHNVYEAPRDQYSYHCDPTWQDEIPLSLRRSAESEPKWRKYAVLMRNTTKGGTVKRHSLVIHSRTIRKHLIRILKDNGNMVFEQEMLEFPAPFEPLFFHWAEIKSIATGTAETDEPLTDDDKDNMKLLVDILTPEFEQAWAARDHFVSTGKIEFDYLWTIFPSRSLVISSESGRTETSYMIRGSERFFSKRDGNVYFILQAFCVDFDGIRYGLKMHPLAIPQYVGYRSPIELNACPIDLHPQKEEIRKRLIARGRRFEAYSKMSYATYEGVAVEPAEDCYSKPKSYSINGRVIVDTEAYVRFNNNTDISLYPLDYLNIPPDPTQSAGNMTGYSLPGSNNYYPDDNERIQEAAIGNLRSSVPTTSGRMCRAPLAPLTDEQAMIAIHTVRGYSMTAKKWLTFNIEKMGPLTWNDRAFNALSLPNNQKAVLLSFARTQGRALASLSEKDALAAVKLGPTDEKSTSENADVDPANEPFDDVIAGKGKGLVVLLEGPPGVGKTLTVESIAEEMRVPLYSIGAGELGSNGSQVEYNLNKVLEMARMWNAVVLLDEADIFLEKRSTHLERNQIVSTFLRLLEYFEGTIFLTTNRIDAIDPAFESRIHLWLPYQMLERSNRLEIWKSNLANVKIPLSDDLEPVRQKDAPLPDFVDGLANYDLNGREIKNSVKMAALLAAGKDEPLAIPHLKTIMDIWKPRLSNRKTGVAPKWD